MKNWIVRYQGLGWIAVVLVCAVSCVREYTIPAPATTVQPESPRDYVEVPVPGPGPGPGPGTGVETSTPTTVVDPNLPPNVRTNGPVAEVILLGRSGVDLGVMMAYVTNWAGTFDLTAAEIIYLKDLGVPQGVVTAMLNHDQQLRNPPASAVTLAAGANAPLPDAAQLPPDSTVAEAVAPAPEVSESAFYEPLAPYGTWVEAEDYGRVWRPSVGIIDPTWQPYFDGGHWVYSECGWYWVSDYSWGWGPFHYGRWFRHEHWGWCWAPDGVWGPSWVCWRYTSGHCGWAPLPPGARYQAGIGLTFHGQRAGVNATFGLGVERFAFVPWSHFHDHALREHAVPRARADAVFQQSAVATRFGGSAHSPSNYGISREHVAAATHTTIVPVSIHQTVGTPVAGIRSEHLSSDGRSLAVVRPPAGEGPKPSAPLRQPRGLVEAPSAPAPVPGTKVAPPGQPAPPAATPTLHPQPQAPTTAGQPQATPISRSNSRTGSVPAGEGRSPTPAVPPASSRVQPVPPVQPAMSAPRTEPVPRATYTPAPRPEPAPRPTYTPPPSRTEPAPVPTPQRSYSPPPAAPAPAPAPASGSGNPKPDQKGR